MPLQSNSGHHLTPLFWYLGFHGNAILNLINTPKASTHYGEYSYDVSWSLMKEIKFFFKSPFFYFHGNCGKVCPIDSDFFLAYLVPLDVDVTGNMTAKLCEVWSEFKFFAPWLPWQQPPFWIYSTPKAVTQYGGYSYNVSWSLMNGIQTFFKSRLFCFHGNCSKVLSNRFRLFWLISFH